MSQRNTFRTSRSASREQPQKVALVNLCWKLKARYQQHINGYVPLNLLIEDDHYRAEVLEAARRSGDTELMQLAADIHALGTTVPIAEPAKSAGGDKPRRSYRWLPWLAALSLPVLAVAVVMALPYLMMPDALLPQAGAVAAAPLPAELPEPALRLHGSNTIGESLAPALVEGLLRQQGYTDIRLIAGKQAVERILYAFPQGTLPELAIELHAHGSGTAFEGLQQGAADIGMASRPIKGSEAESLLPLYGDLRSYAGEHVLALDGLAVIVHPGNPLGTLSSTQIAELFSGAIRDWSEIGGTPGPVTVYARDDHSGTYDTFKSLVLSPHKVKLAEQAHRFESSTELSDRVTADTGAIGFIGLPYVRQAKLVAVNETDDSLPITPTSFTIGTEDYPLSRRLFFYAPPNSSHPLAAALVNFALSQEGQNIVEKTGFISQNIRVELPRIDDSFPVDYQQLTDQAKRLSLNFRFQLNSDQLDNKGQRDLQRLTDYLRANRSQRVMLLGFTDNIGKPEYNRQLSQRRAETLEQSLISLGIYPWSVQGFGDAIPLASNATREGQYKNRRVEVWVQ